MTKRKNELEMKDPSSRRDFFRKAGTAAGGVAVFLIGIGETSSALRAATTEVSPGYDISKHDYLYLVDINKCIGCGSCVRACEVENDVPAHHFRTWVERYQISGENKADIDSPNGGHDGFPPNPNPGGITKAFFVPKLCNHCTNTPCVQLCPVGASYRTEDGVVLVDEKRCIGCGYCVQACPFGSRFISPVTHTATKCILCYHRVTKGLLPMCVQSCPVGARRFGDRKRLGDEVTEIVATQKVRILKPELLTDPNCFYLNMDMEVR